MKIFKWKKIHQVIMKKNLKIRLKLFTKLPNLKKKIVKQFKKIKAPKTIFKNQVNNKSKKKKNRMSRHKQN